MFGSSLHVTTGTTPNGQIPSRDIHNLIPMGHGGNASLVLLQLAFQPIQEVKPEIA